MAMSESQKQATDKWTRNNTRRISCKFMIKSDADVLAWLDQKENKTDYIRQLIRDDIRRQAGMDPDNN